MYCGLTFAQRSIEKLFRETKTIQMIRQINTKRTFAQCMHKCILCSRVLAS